MYKLILLFLLLCINIGADQITKYAAKKNLSGKGTVEVIGNIVILKYAENKGAFLSLGSNLPEGIKKSLLIIVPGIIILAGTVYLIIMVRTVSLLQLTALGCLIGGGISNLYDRIAYKGSVVDFLNIGIGRVRTGIFNVADLSILFGGILVVVTLFREGRLR